MKTRKNIYLIAGILLIVANVFVVISEFNNSKLLKTDAYSIGYFIGSHLLLFIGIFFIDMGIQASKEDRSEKNA